MNVRSFLESRFIAVSWFLAAVSALLLSILTFERAHASAVISEMMWMGSDLAASDEWVEIAGIGGDSTLSGWTLTSVNTKGVEVQIIRFPDDAKISPGQYLVISQFPASNSRLLNEPAFVAPAMTLPNTKLLVRLRDASGAVIDQADDGVGDPMAGKNGKAPDPRASMERMDVNVPGDNASNWTTATIAQGFDSGALVLGTPGYPRSPPPPSPSPPPGDPTHCTGAILEGASGAHLDLRWMPAVPLDHHLLSFMPPLTTGEASITLPATASGWTTRSITAGSGQTILFQSTANDGRLSSGVLIHVQPLQKTIMKIAEFPLITELLPDPIGSDDAEWIELGNFNPDPVTVSDLTLNVNGKGFSLSHFSGSLVPQSSLFIPKFVVGFSLPNASGSLRLFRGTQLLDQLDYPSLPEGISYGRLAGSGFSLQPFCVPTPGIPNAILPWSPVFGLQSGSLSGDAKATFNLAVTAGTGSLAGASCSIDFGDGSRSESCNPPSHTIEKPGDYTINASITNYCGTTMKRTLSAHVGGSSSSSSALQRNDSHTADTSLSSTVSYASFQIPSSTAGSFVLTGVLPNSKGSDRAGEWLEVKNSSGYPASLEGWTIVAGNAKPKRLPPLVLHVDEIHRFMASELHVQLSNNDSSLRLYNPQLTVVSEIFWTKAREGEVQMPSLRGKQVTAHVTRVIDGDTFDVMISDPPVGVGARERVRLIGVDAPETVDPLKLLQPFGFEASNFLKDLLEGKEIELEFDTKIRDAYGRLLAYAALSGGDSAEKDLLEHGLARAYLLYPFARSTEYVGYQSQAQRAKVGLWGQRSSSKTLQESSHSGAILSTPSRSLIISEVFPWPDAKASDPDQSEKWFELWNASDVDVNLSRWMVKDSRGNHELQSSGSMIIMANSYEQFFAHESGLKLNNESGIIILISPEGSTVNVLHYSGVKKGESLAWISNDESQNSGNAGAFCITDHPTPGQANICEHSVASSLRPRKVASGASSRRSIRVARAKPVRVAVRYHNVLSQQDQSQSSDDRVAADPALEASLLHSQTELQPARSRDVPLFSSLSVALGCMGSVFLLQRRSRI
ncbi:lamin tail domain-containing protein [Candidatus Peregrinibacteria bacterium]|nr:lamin tail domain-containing protein [Candidatus Peregrinibacteria bacterium]